MLLFGSIQVRSVDYKPRFHDRQKNARRLIPAKPAQPDPLTARLSVVTHVAEFAAPKAPVPTDEVRFRPPFHYGHPAASHANGFSGRNAEKFRNHELEMTEAAVSRQEQEGRRERGSMRMLSGRRELAASGGLRFQVANSAPDLWGLELLRYELRSTQF
jgi:hypothetical protein